jgi:AraC-like DNA-binding protein
MVKYFSLLLFLVNSIYSENFISIQNHQNSISLLENSKFYCDYKNKSFQELVTSKFIWEIIDKRLHSFGFEDCKLWIQMNIKNFSNLDEFYITSEYAWLDEVDIYLLKNNQFIYQEVNGDQIPFNNRKIKFKLPSFHLSLERFQEYNIYISIKSSSEKLVELNLETKESFLARNKMSRDFFPVFFIIGAVVILFNIFIFLKNRFNINLIYTGMLSCLLIYCSIMNGAFYEYIMPNSSFVGDKLLYTLGFLFLISFYLFWKKFLFLRLYLPLLSQFYNTVIILNILLVLFFNFGFLFHETIEVFARVNLFLIIITSLYSAIKVYKMKFIPAIYSVYGLPVSFFFSLIHYMSGIEYFSGNEFTKNCVYYGFFIEFLVFFYSISQRLQFIESEVKINQKNDINLEEEFIEKIKKSRLENLNREKILHKLNSLMLDEKIYCDEDLNLNRLSEILNIRPDQLSELINQEYKKNFNHFINDFRIEEAKILLKMYPDRTILSILLSCGFNSKSTFNTEFKKKTGLTPKNFRIQSLKS